MVVVFESPAAYAACEDDLDKIWKVDDLLIAAYPLLSEPGF